MLGNDHEKDLFSLLEALKDTMESQCVMNIYIYMYVNNEARDELPIV